MTNKQNEKMWKPATTPWKKYKSDDPSIPRTGQNALWSMEINGQRKYFCGSLFYSGGPGEGPIRLLRQGGDAYSLDDTIYWARIIHLEESEQPNDQRTQNRQSKI